ncbi:MAG: sigma-54-dependent transcriptional regulator [Verrucomicrobiota bacterium]
MTEEHSINEAKILLVEDDENLGDLLREEVEDAGWNAQLTHTAEEALSMALKWHPDVIVSDLRLPGADGMALLYKVRSEIPEGTPDVLIVTAFGTVAKAVESLKAGAEDFLTKPLDLDHFKLSLKRTLEKRAMRAEIKQMKTLMKGEDTFHGMYGRSQSMLTLFQQLRQVAHADGPVLIQGESGTGKELVARALHLESKPKTSPFLAVNCAGIPEHLLESEFFGYEAGAFTGASKSRRGIFAEAEGGTLLLDEISEMPPPLQAKLLRMLQDGKIRPVGSNTEQQVQVRIVAASNRDIEDQVKNGTFREDLFYRLETLPLVVPPLRERGEDIDLLAGIFLNKQAYAAEKRIRGFSTQALDMIHCYPFPGNVRELQNAVERAVVFCHDGEIMPEHLPARIRKHAEEHQDQPDNTFASLHFPVSDDSLPSLEEVEQRYIRHVMEKVEGNKRAAASILGIARRTLYRRLGET